MDCERIQSKKHVLVKVIAFLLSELEIRHATLSTISTLTELLKGFLVEVGNSAHAACEEAGRVEPIAADVELAISYMGVDLGSLQEYTFRRYRTSFDSFQLQRTIQPQYKDYLQVGHREKRPKHVPKYLPRFPDPHTYKRTECFCMPLTFDSETVRRKKAEQRRCVERAMILLEVKAKPLDNLFPQNNFNLFPMISCRPIFPVYRLALLPCDQNAYQNRYSSEESESEWDEIDNPYYKLLVKVQE